MRFLFLVIILSFMNGCQPGVAGWHTLSCPRSGDKCTSGNITFVDQKTCESFVKQVNEVQTQVIRICAQYMEW